MAKTIGLITARGAFEKSSKIIKEAERVKHENAQLFLDANLNTRVEAATQEGLFALEMDIPAGVDGRHFLFFAMCNCGFLCNWSCILYSWF